MKTVSYATVYLWECPDCGTTWQARHRPRAAAQLVCAPGAEQRQASPPGPYQHVPHRGCGSINLSAGRREGIAPNVSL